MDIQILSAEEFTTEVTNVMNFKGIKKIHIGRDDEFKTIVYFEKYQPKFKVGDNVLNIIGKHDVVESIHQYSNGWYRYKLSRDSDFSLEHELKKAKKIVTWVEDEKEKDSENDHQGIDGYQQ